MISFQRLREVVVHNILHLDDTPHRIAWGCALGAFISTTPTMGIQIPVYLVVATLLRANKFSGIPLLYISNPLTAFPVYFSMWWLGHKLVQAVGGVSLYTPVEVMRQLKSVIRQAEADLGSLFTLEFWQQMWHALSPIAVELWIGGIVAGILLAILTYIIAIYMVRSIRRLNAVYRHRTASNIPPPDRS